MKTRGKIALALLVGVPALIAVVGVAFVLWIDRIAAAAVERGATYALGVPTSVAGMDIGLFGGTAEMDGLAIANPEGFDAENFFSLGNGRLAVGLGTLMEETVVIPELSLTGLAVALERKGNQANYQVILDNLARLSASDPAAAPTEPGEPGKRFIVNKLAVRDINAEVSLLPIGGKATRLPVHIDAIELENIGSDTDKGVVLSQLSGIVVQAVLTAIVREAGGVLPDEIARELTAGLAQIDQLGGAAVQVVGEVTAVIDGEVKKVGEAAEQIMQGAQEQSQKITEEAQKIGKSLEEGLGGLLKKEKKDGGK